MEKHAMIDRKAFFDGVRRELGPLNQDQVNGFNAVLAEFERRESTSPDWSIFDLSYMLATAWWETGRTMQPVREAFYVGDFAKAEAWRKRNLRYYPFYGRGLVQLTWDFNYRKASQKLGIDFVKNPDRVMEMPIAVAIMFDGMAEGWFTAKALDDYIDDIDESDAEDLREYTNARRIINGTDKAAAIGAIAIKFERVLLRSARGAPWKVQALKPDLPVSTPAPSTRDGTVTVLVGEVDPEDLIASDRRARWGLWLSFGAMGALGLLIILFAALT